VSHLYKSIVWSDRQSGTDLYTSNHGLAKQAAFVTILRLLKHEQDMDHEDMRRGVRFIFEYLQFRLTTLSSCLHKITPIWGVFAVRQHARVHISGLQNAPLFLVSPRVLASHPIAHPKNSTNGNTVAQARGCQSRPVRRCILNSERCSGDDTCKISQTN
jgi:hypothetical protein